MNWFRVIWFRIRKFFNPSLKRELIGTWTVEQAEHLECLHGMDVEQELIQALQAEISKEMNEDPEFKKIQLNIEKVYVGK